MRHQGMLALREVGKHGADSRGSCGEGSPADGGYPAALLAGLHRNEQESDSPCVAFAAMWIAHRRELYSGARFFR